MFRHPHRLRNAERMHSYYRDWSHSKSAVADGVVALADEEPHRMAAQARVPKALAPDSYLGQAKWQVSKHMPLFGSISPLAAISSQIATIPDTPCLLRATHKLGEVLELSEAC